MKKHILPYFGKMRLDTIMSYDIEKWVLEFSAKGLSNQTANMDLTFLNIMLTDAIRRKMLDNNPSINVALLKKDSRVRDILTASEVGSIFEKESIEKLWKKKIYYLANLLSACTGMRVSEIFAVRKEVLFDGYIYVSDHG